jgi:hypothetical protein
MDGTFRHGDPLENRESPLFDARGQGACLQQLTDLGMVPAMGVIVLMIVGMAMLVIMVSMMVAVIMVVMSGRLPLASVVSLDPETPSGDSPPISPFETAFGEGDRKCREGPLKDILGDTKVMQCRDGHVAADSGKWVDVKGFHGRAWLRIFKPKERGFRQPQTQVQKKLINMSPKGVMFVNSNPFQIPK